MTTICDISDHENNNNNNSNNNNDSPNSNTHSNRMNSFKCSQRADGLTKSIHAIAGGSTSSVLCLQLTSSSDGKHKLVNVRVRAKHCACVRGASDDRVRVRKYVPNRRCGLFRELCLSVDWSDQKQSGRQAGTQVKRIYRWPTRARAHQQTNSSSARTGSSLMNPN